jgi:2-oxoglutarate ferredoxin oxidoreductase subunit beta
MSTATTNNLVYERPVGFTETPTHYCPGCTHGVAHRLIAEVLEEMGVLEKTIERSSGWPYSPITTSTRISWRRRLARPAMATVSRSCRIAVFTYQGDESTDRYGEIVRSRSRREHSGSSSIREMA